MWFSFNGALRSPTQSLCYPFPLVLPCRAAGTHIVGHRHKEAAKLSLPLTKKLDFARRSERLAESGVLNCGICLENTTPRKQTL